MTAGIMTRLALPAIALSGSLMGAGAALAQYGGQYDTLRPPGNVPVRPPAQQPPPQYPPPPQQYPPPPSPYPPPPQYGPPPARTGAIQGEDLPSPGNAPPASGPPGQSPPPPPATAPPPPPPADVVTAPPAQRISNPTAVFNGLDKITGRITSFDSSIGETVQFGALQVTARACYTRPPTETPLTDGFVEVDEVTLQGDIRRIFTGWMFAASPGLHAVEHAIYDVWLVGCKGGGQVAATNPPPATPPPSRQQPPPRQGNSQRPPPQRQPPPSGPPQSAPPR